MYRADVQYMRAPLPFALHSVRGPVSELADFRPRLPYASENIETFSSGASRDLIKRSERSNGSDNYIRTIWPTPYIYQIVNYVDPSVTACRGAYAPKINAFPRLFSDDSSTFDT